MAPTPIAIRITLATIPPDSSSFLTGFLLGVVSRSGGGVQAVERVAPALALVGVLTWEHEREPLGHGEPAERGRVVAPAGVRVGGLERQRQRVALVAGLARAEVVER